jgi:hypothetical protein
VHAHTGLRARIVRTCWLNLPCTMALSVRQVGRGVHLAVVVLRHQFGARCMSIACALPALWGGGGGAAGGVVGPSRCLADPDAGSPDSVGGPSGEWIVARVSRTAAVQRSLRWHIPTRIYPADGR